MDTNMFIDNKLNHITNILAKEKNKKIYIAGDFNFDLLKYSNHSETANFFDQKNDFKPFSSTYISTNQN